MLENPGIVKRPAADAHAGTAGFVEHLLRRLGRDDVAITDNRNGFHHIHHRPDAREVHRSAEALFARAAMHEDRCHAHVFERAGEVRRGEVLVVPAEAHLGGDGNLERIDHAFDQRGRLVQLGHHRRAAAAPRDLVDRAAHVDIHRGNAGGFEIRRGVAHFLGHGPKELHGKRLVCGPGLDEFEGLVAFFEQRTGVDEVGGTQADAADFAHDEPERQVGVTRQRREKQIGRELQRVGLHIGVK